MTGLKRTVKRTGIACGVGGQQDATVKQEPGRIAHKSRTAPSGASPMRVGHVPNLSAIVSKTLACGPRARGDLETGQPPTRDSRHIRPAGAWRFGELPKE